MSADSTNLRRAAREIFAAALQEVDAAQSLRRALRLDDARLRIANHDFNLAEFDDVYSISIGKAALPLASVLSEALGGKLTGGIVSAPPKDAALSSCWRVFAGGHPLPNEASFAAARASIDLLRRANAESALIIFLISGGGSSMLESPRDERVTLEDLREANRALVGCGATIAEINAVRRRLSLIKGGSLSRLAPRATQVTLIISDTNLGEEANVASGPTITSLADSVAEPSVPAVVELYGLRQSLPASVARALVEASEKGGGVNEDVCGGAKRLVHVLLDNQRAVHEAAKAARARGFLVETATDLTESPIADGCRELVSRLFELRQRAAAEGTTACLISGGEFMCPVRGSGLGGRNSEATLRCAIEIDARERELASESPNVAVLHAGTDGVDGNSPAAGATADETTLRRAQARGLDAPEEYLARSDSYSFFQRLGDAIEIGPTGTNVRDLRILLAR